MARAAARAQGTTGEVLVIGAGWAGLASAYELGKAGFGIHFTGEHTETNSMDGAIKSGARVVKEIKVST
ncbi:MAG: hypothetical protein V3S55_05550 [Nitrospiraceae bacterium]